MAEDVHENHDSDDRVGLLENEATVDGHDAAATTGVGSSSGAGPEKEAVFQPLSADDVDREEDGANVPTEVESLCVNCHSNVSIGLRQKYLIR